MAEEGRVYDFKGLEKQLQSLFRRFTCNELQADSKPFCSDFCKLVEEYASHWHVPLPQLRVLEVALCYFTRVSAFLTVNCDHVLNTLSCLALSIFELLLFFEQKDFCQEPLKKFTITFQECCLVLAKHQNVHVLQVEQSLRAGGPWSSQTLQAVLSESSLPQTEVDSCISSEPPVFFELRVQYLLSCQRLTEALALAKCCAQHPKTGQHLFFLQVYLTCLYKTSQHERLHKELADFSGKDAVHIICNLECEEKDELLLAFSRALLSQQLRRGDMFFLSELVYIWSKLHSRLKTSKEALLKECHQLMLCATDVNSIFPFISVIMQELSEGGIQFCVELCANALRSCLPCDVVTKSLIYKTIASLVPADLEICRACALLVFFLERSVEAYKIVYILYMHPDQQYHVDCCPIGNSIRFETMQILKKDLYFDPEFWNLIALRTNCLKLMNEKVLSAALEEIMEEKWVPNYCLKEPNLSPSRSVCEKVKGLHKAKKQHHKEDQQNHRDSTASKRLKAGKTQINNYHSSRKKGNRGTRQWKELEPLRRSSLWQLDRIHSNRATNYGENRRTTRLSEKIPPKRKIRKPKWLLEDSGTLENNTPLTVRRRHQRLHYTSIRKRSEKVKNNTKDKVNSEVKVKENDKKKQKEVPLDSVAACTPQVILELSLPDNELMGTFSEEPCNRQRGFPQMLFYRPTVKIPSAAQPEKPVDRNEVILRGEDTSVFMEMLHCYARQPKRKANMATTQDSASTTTPPSGQASASKEDQLCDKPAVEMKVTISSQTHKVTDNVLKKSRERIALHDKSAVTGKRERPQEAEVPQSRSSATVLPEESAVEMKVTVASQKHRQSPKLEKTQTAEHVSDTVSQASTPEKKPAEICDQILPFSCKADEHSLSQDSFITNEEVLLNGTLNQEGELPSLKSEDFQIPLDTASVKDTNSISGAKAIHSDTSTDNINNLPALTSGTDLKTVVPQEQDKAPAPDMSASEDSKTENNAPPQKQPASTCSTPVNTAWHETQEVTQEEYDSMDPPPECEESKLEYCCTFCEKDFKGSRVVAHAMFHYRKDECMFCSMAFRDDLKAMMHLSNHIEKLKKSIKSQENLLSMTKDKLKTSVEATSLGNVKRGRGRPKKSCPLESRKLRSNDKLTDGQEQSNAKHLRSKTLRHKVNGHIWKSEDSDRVEKEVPFTKNKRRETVKESEESSKHPNHETIHSSSASVKIENEKLSVCSNEESRVQKITSKANKRTVTETNAAPQEKLCCNVDGCSWFTHKNGVALLYHVLEDHHTDTKPLELAFRVADNKCSICKRVLWSFEHFVHHVERHRLLPRHPCLHKGCAARFKSGIEMRRHARKHSPLQATCCRPGCSKLFICLWALNLHEKDHYKVSTVDNKKEREKNTLVDIKQEDCTPIDRVIKKNEKSTLRQHNSVKMDIKASFSGRNKSKDSSVSKKDFPAKPAATRLLQKLKKRQATKANPAHQSAHKILSSGRKPNGKVSHSLKKKAGSLNTKALPPRSTKSSMQDNTLSENQIKVTKISAVSGKSKEKAKMDSDGTVGRKSGRKQEKVAKVKDTRKIEKKSTSDKTSNSKTLRKKKSVNRKKEAVAAAVVESAVIEEKYTTDNVAPEDSRRKYTTQNKSKSTKRKDGLVANISSVIPDNKDRVSGKNRDKKESNGKSVVQNVEDPAARVYDSSLVDEKAIMETSDSLNDTSGVSVVQEDMHVAAPEEHSNPEITDSSASKASDSALVVPSIVQKPPDADHSTEENSKMETSDSSVNQNDVSALAFTSVVDNVEHVLAPEPSKMDATDSLKSNTNNSTPVVATASENTTSDPEPDHEIPVEEHCAIGKNSQIEPTYLVPNTTLVQKDEQLAAQQNSGGGSALVNTTEIEPATIKRRKKKKIFPEYDDTTLAKHQKKVKVSPNEDQKNAKKRQKSREAVRTSASKKSKAVVQNVEESSAVEEKAMADTTDSTLSTADNRAPAINNSTNKTSKEKIHIETVKKQKKLSIRNKTHTAKEKEDKSKKQGVDRRNKPEKKPEVTSKDGGVKKRKKEPSKTVKSKSIGPQAEVKAAPKSQVSSSSQVEEAEAAAITAESLETLTPAEVQTVEENEHDETCLKYDNKVYLMSEDEESPLVAFEKALTEYKKKPYMRLPATAYLEERYTTMPKRRKDMSTFFRSSRKSHKAAENVPQKQRCASCFATFSSEEDLQWHLQQKCSSLFGFESDEDGTS